MDNSYFGQLKLAMHMLSKQKHVRFMGQAVLCEGTAMYHTLKDLPEEQRLELPVAEAMQLGMSIGMSLQGYFPISIFPRFNFLISAMDQLVNHLDVMYEMSQGEYNPRMIIRTSVGSEHPLFPGLQHIGNFSSGFNKMFDNIVVIELNNTRDIIPSYELALQREYPTILVEYADLYGE